MSAVQPGGGLPVCRKAISKRKGKQQKTDHWWACEGVPTPYPSKQAHLPNKAARLTQRWRGGSYTYARRA